MIELPSPDRPVGTWKELDTLEGREDLNVVFVMIDTLRSDRLEAFYPPGGSQPERLVATRIAPFDGAQSVAAALECR